MTKNCQNNCQILYENHKKNQWSWWLCFIRQATKNVYTCEVSSLFWFKAHWVKTVLKFLKRFAKEIIKKVVKIIVQILYKNHQETGGVDDYISSSRPQASSKLLKIFTLVRFQFYLKARWDKTALKFLKSFVKEIIKKIVKIIVKYCTKIIKKTMDWWLCHQQATKDLYAFEVSSL